VLVRPRLGLGLLALGLTLGLCLGVATRHHATAAKGPRPNIVLILTDDQRADDLAAMQRTNDLITDAGVTFARAYSSFPLCCPSRATILTGQYAHNHGVWSNVAPRGGYRRFRKRHALPVWLRRAGYRTIHVGKYLNGYGNETPAIVPRGWTDWYGAIEPSGRFYYGYTLNENGARVTHGSPGSPDPAKYQTDVYSAKAAAAIRSAAGRPFFLQLAFYAPHTEDRRERGAPRPALRHQGAYQSLSLPASPAFNESNVDDKPPFLRRQLKPLTGSEVEEIQYRWRRRQESLLSVDEAVSGIVSALQETGVLDRTYIIFTSDNGFFQGEHGISAGKILPHEPASRVPLLIRGPGIPAGGVSQELVANVDLAPTIARLAGAKPSVALDGRSLLPFARRPGLRTRRPIVLEAFARRVRDVSEVASIDPDNPRATAAVRVDSPGYGAIRGGNFLYVRYANGETELYDLRSDPHQLRNVTGSPRYRRTRQALARAFHRFKDCEGRACRRAIGPIPSP
jgi:N-acetylglucosamine-6-sulfatase